MTQLHPGCLPRSSPYTRLIVYSRLEDLRAKNETFDKIVRRRDRPTCAPDPIAFALPRTVLRRQRGPGQRRQDDATSTKTGYGRTATTRQRWRKHRCHGQRCPGRLHAAGPHRYPWVYMGPGIWIDPDVKPDGAHVSISGSLTRTTISRVWPTTAGRSTRANSGSRSHANPCDARIQNSSHLRFEHSRHPVRGQVTMKITGATDWCSITSASGRRPTACARGEHRHSRSSTASSTAASRAGTSAMTARRSTVSWRTDKSVTNNLGKQTLRSLFVPSGVDTGTTIHHCEFHDAHDLYLGGSDVDFHHNWIYDLNDDGLFLDANGRANVRVHENVVLKTLSPINFASDKKGPVENVGGPFFIYRNLVDVREPTPGYRPSSPATPRSGAYGNTFKSNGEDGPYALFQNTFLVYAQAGQASYRHYANLRGSHRRRSFNNIFVAINPDAASDPGITFVPSPSFPAETDGNNYTVSVTATTRAICLPAVLVRSTGSSDWRSTSAAWPAAAGRTLCATVRCSSRARLNIAPGYEAQSIESNPRVPVSRRRRRHHQGGRPAIARTTVLPGNGCRLARRAVALAGRCATRRYARYRVLSLRRRPLRVGIDGRRSVSGLACRGEGTRGQRASPL